MDSFLEQLAGRLQISGADVITADETKDWPEGKRDELIAGGVLTPIENATGVVCDQCEENCYIEPSIRTYQQDGEEKAIGVFVCTRNPDIGRIEVDLNRLRQWKINNEKLQSLGYCIDFGPEPEDELITVQEAANISGMDKGTISRLASENKIKHNREMGIKRRVSKLSVLLFKNSRETERLKKDFDDYREDLRKIPNEH